MAKYELTWYAPEKRVMRFDKLEVVDVRIAKQIDEIKKHKYEVNFNMIWNFTFQYEDGKFYIDFEDEERMIKQNEEHLALVEGIEDKQEQKDILKDKYVNYILRHEFVLIFKDVDIVKEMEKLIKSISS